MSGILTEETHVISHNLTSQFPRDQPKHIENKIMKQIHESVKMKQLTLTTNNFIC